jgi:hypothetical protein
MAATLDHLAFAVRSLDEGARWLEARLGVPLEAGGEHPAMGTHNRLLRLGDGLYLELIAVNPAAAKPARPRWFALDDPAMQERLTQPRLIAWVAATGQLSLTAKRAAYAPGPIVPMTRGSLNWLITIPEDGQLVDGGLMPTLIEWPEGVHPSARLPERGVSLELLELGSPNPDVVKEGLNSIGFDALANNVRVIQDRNGPRLTAYLAAPPGLVRFDSRTSAEDGIFMA